MVNVKEAAGVLIRKVSVSHADQWDLNSPSTQGTYGNQIDTINRFLRFNACNDSPESMNIRLKLVGSDVIEPTDKSLNLWLANFEKHIVPAIVKGEITLNA